MIKTYRPADPLLSTQWHLFDIGRLGFNQNDSLSGLERVWADYRGKGVAVGIWDDGVQSTHWDLAANYDASRHVYVDRTLNPGQPTLASDSHGTAVAGLIAADDNGRGGVGVAPGAGITGIKIFGGADDINSQWTRYLQTLDNLGRFDVTNHSYGAVADYRVYGDTAKFEASLVSGRGGLGTINVKSAGNENYDGGGIAVDASRATITVAALTTDGQVASYSSYGAHVLVSAPAGSVTTDRLGGAGYNSSGSGDYTTGFGGTSAAAPVTTGVIALMLDANDRLGWRDVQAILAYSAQGTGSLVTGKTVYEDSAWRTNGADNWNGGGLHFSNDYGFGVLNAHAAVRMAEVWTLLERTPATSANEARAMSGVQTVNAAINSNATVTYSFNVAGRVELEHVALTLSLTHSDMTDLRIVLVSPEGTEISVFDGSSARPGTADRGLTYTFGLEGFRGEISSGTWTLRVSDAAAGDTGVLHSVALTGYGSAVTVNDVYHYTDEVLAALARSGGGARMVLTDKDGGIDWINAAAMWKDLTLDLRDGTTSKSGGSAFVTIAAGSVIENATGGDGDDSITGNAADNVIAGMRGDDTLVGGDGTDTGWFFGNSSAYSVVDQGGWITVTSLTGGYGVDVLVGFEFARFDDVLLNLIEAFADETAPALAAMTFTGGTSFVDPAADIVLTFTETVLAGKGSFTIHGPDGVVETIAADDARVSVQGKTVTIDPAAPFLTGSVYHVVIGDGAVTDRMGNAVLQWGSPVDSAFETRPAGNSIVGTGSANSLGGTASADVVQGLGGSDALWGYGGNDVLHGGGGNDSLVGGGGNDTYYIDSLRDVVWEQGNAGYDTVRTTLGAYKLGTSLEALVYDGSDKFTGIGNDLANFIRGGNGNDALAGGAGNDALSGGAGDDRLIGGTGIDVLTGGDGADVFVFVVPSDSQPATPDTITDFERGVDHINLGRMDSNMLMANRQSFSLLIGDEFDGTAGQLRVSQIGGGVLVEGDANGDGIADFALKVMGPTALLTADDFIF